MYRVVLNKQAVKDFEKLKACGLLKKARLLVDVVAENPFQTPPSYESLVGNFSGLYSRRINIKHRFVYKVMDEPTIFEGVKYQGTVVVVSMWSHYETLK